MNGLIIKVPYVSLWDGGVEITTSAKLNLKTGALTDIETVDPADRVQVCEREYIILNDDQIDTLWDENHGYWVQLHNGQVGPCTENYAAHREAMADLSIADVVKITDYVAVLSQFLNDGNEVLDDMDSILAPFEVVINTLRTPETCRHQDCGCYLYKSDLPQYDYVCPECDENF
ncbi:hypothetical protein DS742_25365 [Lacrimispora amygdalina]|uniref:Uncharacterized protein n=1 Tax=Lacrimispora amygdalina TaxID=253257 RepID=A0A3E2N557_9FIRM|nr:hypothetical protein [Clostridium indicum]RFZ76106.1 hypothetical protein DS742_25365 [Clostridium indicum]